MGGCFHPWIYRSGALRSYRAGTDFKFHLWVPIKTLKILQPLKQRVTHLAVSLVMYTVKIAYLLLAELASYVMVVHLFYSTYL